MTSARESALHANEGAPNKVNTKPSGPDPLEGVVNATPADRLGWALLEQGYDPALFDLADDDTRPATVVVRVPLRTATPGLGAVWWDGKAGEAVGRVEGTAEELREAIAVLVAMTAAGPGDLPNAPPEEPLDLLRVIVATAHRLGIVVRFRPRAMANGGRLAVNRVREYLPRIPVGKLASHLRGTLVLLATFADPDGSNAYPSALTLAEILGLSRSTVSGHLRQLEALGVVPDTGERKSWTQHKHTKIRYLDFAVLGALTDDAPDRQTTNDAPDRQTTGTNDDERPTNDDERPTNDGLDRHNHPSNPPSNRSVAESDEEQDEPASLPTTREKFTPRDVLTLGRLETARRQAAGEQIERPAGFAKNLAKQDPDRLTSRDTFGNVGRPRIGWGVVDVNPKQKRFAQEYAIDHNGAQAAIRSGYSEARARHTASRLMANVAGGRARH